MFSKSKINDPIETSVEPQKPAPASAPLASAAKPNPNNAIVTPSNKTTRPKPTIGSGPSIISPDLKITGNLHTEGDLQVEGTVEGDIRANLLTIGENAVIRGEIVADDVVVNGHVIGRIRGQKVRLTSTGRVEGDILHKTIAIEAGAHFEGSVHRGEDPINSPNAKPAAPKAPTAATPINAAKPNPSSKAG